MSRCTFFCSSISSSSNELNISLIYFINMMKQLWRYCLPKWFASFNMEYVKNMSLYFIDILLRFRGEKHNNRLHMGVCKKKSRNTYYTKSWLLTMQFFIYLSFFSENDIYLSNFMNGRTIDSQSFLKLHFSQWFVMQNLY